MNKDKLKFIFKQNLKPLALGLFLLFYSSLSVAAVVRPLDLTLRSNGTSQTEGSICTDCKSNSSIRSLAQLGNQTERIFNAAYFDDGNDKQAVVDLRARKARGETLTSKEEALLQAAARTGRITMCDGKDTTNAFVVNINGKDAIITTAHAFINTETGQPKCDLSRIGYYPNFSFYDSQDGDSKPSDFEKLKINTDGKDPLNLQNVIGTKGQIEARKDFLIFFLEEKVSDDRLPGGNQRGVLSFSNTISRTGNLSLIGTDPNFRDAKATAYQECRFETIESLAFHSCDTLPGVSSSLLTTYENGEYKFYGMHAIGLNETGLNANENLNWNTGLTAKIISDYLSKEGQSN